MPICTLGTLRDILMFKPYLGHTYSETHYDSNFHNLQAGSIILSPSHSDSMENIIEWPLVSR